MQKSLLNGLDLRGHFLRADDESLVPAEMVVRVPEYVDVRMALEAALRVIDLHNAYEGEIMNDGIDFMKQYDYWAPKFVEARAELDKALEGFRFTPKEQ